MAHDAQRRISLGIVVFAVFLPVKAWCAQQDLNLQPLAPEANSVSNSGANLHENTASKNASKSAAGVVIPALLFVAAEGLDVHSTWQARSNGNGIEGNRVMNVSTSKQIAIKAATSAAVVFLAAKLHRHHPTIAKVMLYGGSLAIGSVAARNYRIAHR